MATSKTFYAVTAHDFGGMGHAQHIVPAIIEYKEYLENVLKTKEKAAAAGTLIEEVTAVKAKQVQMPNGRKAKLFNVGNEVWARYSDGSATKYEA